MRLPHFLSLPPDSLSLSRVLLPPSPICRRGAAATDHGQPRDRTRNNRPDLADVPRPISSQPPPPRRRKTRIPGRLLSELPVDRSLSSEHYFRRVFRLHARSKQDLHVVRQRGNTSSSCSWKCKWCTKQNRCIFLIRNYYLLEDVALEPKKLNKIPVGFSGNASSAPVSRNCKCSSNVMIHAVDKFGSFLRQFPLFPNAFLVGGWCRRLLYYSTCRSGPSHWVLLLELFSWSWESYSSFSTSLQIQIVKTSAEDKKEHKPPLQLS
ncbi:uncharacterized protein LOC109948521 [Prunus persica]|nr:uncharacterized protein LOC109948521 [Prunus persica]